MACPGKFSFPLLILAVLTAPGVGAVLADQSPQAQTQPATRPAFGPIVYVPKERPAQLTDEQTELIAGAAEKQPPGDARPWFVAVVFNSNYETWAFAYYAPDSTLPRLRKGRYADIHLAKEATVDRHAHVEFGKRWTLAYQTLRQYVQVSRPDKPFGDKLQVPGPADIPCERPSYDPQKAARKDLARLTDAELVRLVDFARSALAQGDLAFFEDDCPICTIRVEGPDLTAVAAGVSDWGGCFVQVRKHRDGSYEVVGSGMWSDAVY